MQARMAEGNLKGRRERNGRGSVVCEKRGSGIRWRCRITLEGGRSLNTTASTEKDGWRKIEEFKQAAKAGKPTPKRRTIAQLMDEYISAKSGSENRRPVKPTTLRGYRQYADEIKELWGGILARDLTAGHVADELHKLPWSPLTIRNLRAVLRQALNWGKARGYVSDNVCMDRESLGPKVSRKPRKHLEATHVQALLADTSGTMWEPLYLLAALRGLRPSELVGITWDDVNLDEAILHIRHSLHRIGRSYYLDEDDLKTEDSTDVVALPDVVVAALESHHARQNEERLASTAWKNQWDLVFTSPKMHGSPLNIDSVNHDLQHRLERLRLPKVTTYGLRHTSITLHATLTGGDVHQTQKFARHGDVRTTMNIYAHRLHSDDKRLADQLAALVAGPGSA